jgi:hypothetical protein
LKVKRLSLYSIPDDKCSLWSIDFPKTQTEEIPTNDVVDGELASINKISLGFNE